MRRAVFLFDYTGIMAQPWLDAGYECWCFDGQHKPGIERSGNLLKVGMYFEAHGKLVYASRVADLVGEASHVFGFPECTNLTSAGAKHFKSKRNFNPLFQLEAIELCDLVRCVGVMLDSPWAFENPRGVVSTQYFPKSFSFDPCDYGGYLAEDDKHPLYPEVYPPRDAYKKDTFVWCGNGYKEPKRNPVDALSKNNPGWEKCGGRSTRTKNIRSATPRGFAQANFEANRL